MARREKYLPYHHTDHSAFARIKEVHTRPRLGQSPVKVIYDTDVNAEAMEVLVG